MKKSIITFCGLTAKVICDEKCEKAWGLNSRPKIEHSEDPDDYTFLSDKELEVAPKDPGTYEGGDGKPRTTEEHHNRWCVRECERSEMSKPFQWRRPLALPSFEERVSNQ